MSDKANWVGTTEIDDGNCQHTGTHRFTGGSKFVIADATDATKTVVFNLSGLTTGTETEFTVPESDSAIVTLSAVQSLTNKGLDDTTTTFFDTAGPTKLGRFELSGVTGGQTRVLTWPDFNGTVATLAGTEVFTNKKLSDSTCTFADQGDATKQLAFQCSGITTATTRTVTIPDSDGTMAYLAGSTLTTATLTSPTINAATLTGAIAGGTLTPAILTAIDNTFTVVDNGDPTKVAALQCSGITAGQTRTMTVPDSSGTIAYLAGSTLTTTTLTSPTINEGTFNRAAQVYTISAANNSKVGTTAGWTVAAANNLALVTLPASQTASTLVVGVTGLKVGWTITGFYLIGQIEAAGNVCTLDADLRVLTAVASDVTDASLGSITQISVTADTAVVAANSTKTLAAPTVILATTTYYILIAGTTAADTDVALQGVALIVTEI